MIFGFTLLLACQLVGEGLTRGLSLSVPGPVIGLALLAAGLWVHAAWRGAPPDEVEQTPLGRLTLALLANLGLLFVPAGVGIVQQLGVFGDHGVAIGGALFGSTILALLATVVAFRLAKRMMP